LTASYIKALTTPWRKPKLDISHTSHILTAKIRLVKKELFMPGSASY